MSKSIFLNICNSNTCPSCGSDLVIRSGKHGSFIGCNNYPQCDYMQLLNNQSDGHIVKVLTGQLCPLCNFELVLRQGRYGMFIGCSDYPACEYTQTVNYSNETTIHCPQCLIGRLIQRRSRYGKIFYACDRYPDCRYIINSTPVEGTCPYCCFPLLTEKKLSQGIRRFCANKSCGKSVVTDNEGR